MSPPLKANHRTHRHTKSMGCRLDVQSPRGEIPRFFHLPLRAFSPRLAAFDGTTIQACQGSLSHLVTVMGARNAPKRLCRLTRTFHIPPAYRICGALSWLLISNALFGQAKHRLRDPSITYMQLRMYRLREPCLPATRNPVGTTQCSLKCRAPRDLAGICYSSVPDNSSRPS
ncbi:hypothetical protein GGI35DRAFT_306866 [Trichoderma velutinum]